ncbi:hypothetical protein ACQKGC_02220 [Allorhizobium pseudoryzae]|uniref:hypothetical protein n=1 Tax=Allorhizobium pseudoryzae TaxID=379684 RepID=UPI003CFFFF04
METAYTRKARLLIPDTSPLSLLSMAGADGLDTLFVPDVEIWVTDMVEMEVTREPDSGDDRRLGQRRVLAEWFGRNRHRIRIMRTPTGEEYAKAMTSWSMSGSRPELKPRWTGRGDYSLLDILSIAETVVEEGEAVVLLVDDRRARAALRQSENLDLDILSTRAFIAMLETEFGVADAGAIWTVIDIAAGRNAEGKLKVPDPLPEDPIYVRKS